MKKVLVIAAGTLALAAGTASAGEGCNYGQHSAALASAEPAVETTVEENRDPKLLALVKQQEEAAEATIETVVQN